MSRVAGRTATADVGQDVLHRGLPCRQFAGRPLEVLRRTLRRRFRHEVLWNGNVEGPLHHIFRDPEHIIRWAWTSYPRAAERVVEARRHRPDLIVVRLRTGHEIARWRAGLAQSRR